MAYKDKVQQREAVRKAVAKHRGITPEGITDTKVPSGGEHVIPPEWQAVKRYISRPGNLDRMQRIAGSLGVTSNKVYLADQVYFGIGGLTITDIGKVIGTQEARLPK